MYSLVLVLATLLIMVPAFSYFGYKMYKIKPKSTKDVDILMGYKNKESIEFLTLPNKVNDPIIILVAPAIKDNFVNYIAAQKLNFNLEVDDLQNILQEEQKFQSLKSKLKKGEAVFERFFTYNEIMDYLNGIQQKYPELVCVEVIGKSYESRNLTLVSISTNKLGKKPKIFLDAGIHAREWISPAVALFVIYQLVENPSNRHLLEYIDWIILPIVNPDGYQYTFTDYRLWRKTRSKGKQCDGVDANRNFDFHWMESGATSNECSNLYAGPRAFSEMETVALSNYLLKTENVSLYLTLHSCGKFLLYPWGCSSKLPDHWKILKRLGKKVAKAIENVRGTYYVVGSASNMLYSACGISSDWAYSVANITLAYIIELPCGKRVPFILENEEILPILQETWEGIKVYHDYVVNGANKVSNIFSLY